MMKLQEYIASRDNFDECTKCTVCTAYCPVLELNPEFPGPKQAGPDGERLRLKDPISFNYALKQCLNCKRCEVACPSGVLVADLIQLARIRYDRTRPGLRDRMLASTDLIASMVRPVAPLVNTLSSLKPARAAMDSLLKIDKRCTLPRYSAGSFESWLKRRKEEQDAFDSQVAYFHGCYVNYNCPGLGKDLVKVLNALGVGVRLLDKEKCCGMPMISNKMTDEASRNAEHNVAVIRKAVREWDMKVIATSSSCILAIREEYPALLDIDNSDIHDSLLMASRYIFELIENGAKLKFRKNYHKKVAYHAPCHMERLGWNVFSENLLKFIPGVELHVLDSACCGMAGTYGFKKENYENSQSIGARLFGNIRKLDPDVVACDCESCKWQIEMSTGYPVDNPVSILAEALED